MEIPSIVGSGEDMQPYTLLVGGQMDSIFLKMYLEIYTQNFKMDLDFWDGTSPSGNASLGNNYRRTQGPTCKIFLAM